MARTGSGETRAGRLAVLLIGLLLLSSAAPCSAAPQLRHASFSAPADPCRKAKVVAKACAQLACQVFRTAEAPVVFAPASIYRPALPVTRLAWVGLSPSPPDRPPRLPIL